MSGACNRPSSVETDDQGDLPEIDDASGESEFDVQHPYENKR